ncbi:MAG: FAD-dependent oxidoreductase [Myxococcaceae bacterium]|nr:FAD-dependent oxidoreductase [Myxococcaceae bacterium]
MSSRRAGTQALAVLGALLILPVAILFAAGACVTGSRQSVATEAPSGAETAPDTGASRDASPASVEADLVVVGSGIAGLSAALEAATAGARVVVVDMWSVFGGHAVMASGEVNIVDTPLQRASGVTDSPELAYEDFVRWGGEDVDRSWARRYARESRTEIYDWMTGLGVTFEKLNKPPGNSVPRMHETKGRGLGLVLPLFRACTLHPGIRFEWNTRVDDLLQDGSRIVGVRGTRLRTGEAFELRARAVLLATGGFQSNLDMVREHWPVDLPAPERLLVGAGRNATGSGHALATRVGGFLRNLEHQWNYATGLPDPRDPEKRRGLNARNRSAIWVNAAGRRFVNESEAANVALAALLKQQPQTYWEIFDESLKKDFWVSGTEWAEPGAISKRILENPRLAAQARSLPELAAAIGLPEEALLETVRRYNEMIEKGEDTEFNRFGPHSRSPRPYSPQQLAQPPFYAVQHFPVTRKSMGGVAVDEGCRVRHRREGTIPGLYAAGELTGFALVNGKASLEGTFLGAAILTGRSAARSVVADLTIQRTARLDRPLEAPKPPGAPQTVPCAGCHELPRLVTLKRPGYRHFESSHAGVLRDDRQCSQCHAGMAPYDAPAHKLNPLELANTCVTCHAAAGG